MVGKQCVKKKHPEHLVGATEKKNDMNSPRQPWSNSSCFTEDAESQRKKRALGL